jgi:DNA primase
VKIPQNKIDEIVSSTDIVEVISAYTPLRKAGRSFVGRCPFHEERTPSFSVSQEKGVYHCFGCGKSGNVFTFLMETEKLSFFEAAKLLAEKANIVLEFENEPYDPDRNKTEQLYEINRAAGKYYHELLKSREGEYAREYLNQRGIKDDMITKFGLGYSLREKDALFSHFSGDFKESELIDSGLVLIIGASEKRDRFRGRLMFPIFNEGGKVIAFGGRRIWHEGTTDEAKYINSPETRIYNKSKTLYGLNFAKSAIKSAGFAILVEGYLDLIALYQNGIENVIASSGTSLTQLHTKILSRYTKEVVVVFDSDIAGQNASRRAIELIIENDMSVSVIPLPKGEDPDTFIRKSGKDGFITLLNKRQSIIDFIGDSFRQSGRLESPEGKTEFVREIIGLIAKMRDEIKRDFYIKDIAEKFSVYESVVRKELDKHLRLRTKGLTREFTPKADSSTLPQKESSKISTVELFLIRLLIDSDDRTKSFLMNNLEIDLISNPEASRIINYIMMNIDNPGNISHVHLFNSFQDDASKHVIGRALLDDNYVMQENRRIDYLQEAKSVLKQLKILHIKSKIKELESEVKSGDPNSSITLELLGKQQELRTKQQELEKKQN